MIKHLMRYVLGAATAALLSVSAFVPTFAAAKTEETPLRLVVDSEHLAGKVNDPVSKKTKNGFIVRENASFHLETGTPDTTSDSAQVVFYINEYLADQDQGVKCRVLMKDLAFNEEANMLPKDVFDEELEDGAAYDFINRCYVVRAYLNENQTDYVDYYFGLVDDLTFERMSSDAAQAATEVK